MHVLIDLLPWLIAMAVLIACSAFFSGSEAALFYLRWEDRRILAAGNRSQRAAAKLVNNPDRLLSAVLLWNLATNMTYFGISSIVAMRIERELGNSHAFFFSGTALLVIIFASEMVPKSIAVLSARRLAGLVGIPLAACVRLLDPVMPTLQLISLLSRRLIWPRFAEEPYLELSDLERAIELSSSDTPFIEHERATLRNIVMLSDIRADEWMRPRTQFLTFQPPVALADMQGKLPPSGYLLVTEPLREDIAAAVTLRNLTEVPAEHLEQLAEPVVHVPWCTTVADVLQQLQRSRREVSVVVNEYGETIGILTFTDILATLFHQNPSRTDRLLAREPIQPITAGVWHVSGMTSLRRLERYFQVALPANTNVTVGGVIQDLLQRLAEPGDELDWGPFHLRVIKAPHRGQALIELRLLPAKEQEA